MCMYRGIEFTSASFLSPGKGRDIKNHITFHHIDTLQAHSMRVFETVLVISKIPD